MREQTVREIPWPGPRPYEEKHWRMFYGRAAEVRRVVSSIGANALSVLVGGSGTGKTSLVRAGAVPELRNRRYHPRGSHLQWPVLVLRRWGAESGTTIDQILHDQLAIAIDAVEEWAEMEDHGPAREDAALFRSALKGGTRRDSVTDTLLGLAAGVAERSETDSNGGASANGLILVFDQFEELLRPGGQTLSEALAVIQELYQRGSKNIHVLLSMRQEYLYALRPLEGVVGGLVGRSIVLSPMPEKTVLDVIRDASGSSDLPILEDAAAKIVGWLAEAVARRGGSRTLRTPSMDGRNTLDMMESAATPDLLKLQAVLWEIFEFAVKRREAKVDLDLLTEFELSKASHLEQTDPEDGQHQQLVERIVDGSLERWIEFALEKKLVDEAPTGVAGVGEPGRSQDGRVRSFEALTEDLPENDLHKQVRRIAIKVAPHQKALDYKVPQEENALFRLALGDDIWKLGMKNAKYRDKIRIVDEEVPRLNWDNLDISQSLEGDEQHYLSGLAKERQWSPAETGNRLAACFRETLHRLKQGNILTRIVKSSGEQRSSVWELVHDQFGPTFLKWAHEHRDSWHDCESSFTVSSGIQPIMAPGDRVEVTEGEASGQDEGYRLERISWRGCSIEPGQHRQLVLRDVRFVDCYLVGMVFERCRFEGGLFESCDLNGALFRNCEFVDVGRGAPTFDRCDSTSLAIVSGTIQSLVFRDCELQQPTIMARLNGKIRFNGGSRVAQAYFEVQRGGSEKPEILFEDKSRAFFCSADLDSLDFINYGAQRDVASGALPDGFFERRPRRAQRNKA